MTKILIADDNNDLLEILVSRFRAVGFEVVSAQNGTVALEVARREQPEIAVLDVMMPELNGFQVCRRLRDDDALKEMPIVLLTAKDTEADQFWGFEVGADLYLTKPIEPGEVVAEVQKLLER
jgi:DNA-binding response OmpR family regulator